MKKIKVCVIGCVLMSKDLFLSLNKISSLEIVGVITKKKSNYHSDFYSLKSEADQIGAKVFFSEGKEDEKMINFVKNIKADLGFCIGWSHLFSKKFIKLLFFISSIICGQHRNTKKIVIDNAIEECSKSLLVKLRYCDLYLLIK